MPPSPSPLQITALTRLRRLHLSYLNFEGDSAVAYQPLAALAGSLERLRLEQCDGLPPCLPQLTGLQALAIHEYVGDDGENAASNATTLEAALPNLRHLSCLVVEPHACQLRSLPPGDWLTSLRTLAAPAAAIAASLPALSAAQQLRHLALAADGIGSVPPRGAALWCAGRQAAPLRCGLRSRCPIPIASCCRLSPKAAGCSSPLKATFAMRLSRLFEQGAVLPQVPSLVHTGVRSYPCDATCPPVLCCWHLFSAAASHLRPC